MKINGKKHILYMACIYTMYFDWKILGRKKALPSLCYQVLIGPRVGLVVESV